MKAAPRIDLGAKTAEQLIQEFEIKFSNSHVLLWEKPVEAQRGADISLPKFLFRDEVLNQLEKSLS